MDSTNNFSLFRHIIIDSPNLMTSSELQLTSFFHFLAEEVTDAYVVEMNRANWIDKEKNIYNSGYGSRWFPREGQDIKLEPNDELLYTPWDECEPGWGFSSGSSYEVKDAFVYTKNKWVKDVILIKSGIDAKTSILLMAAAGLEFSLPNIIIRNLAEDELHQCKTKLIEERENYLLAVSDLAKESYDRISSGAYKDAIDWARNESQFRINKKVFEIEKSVKKLDKKIIDRLKIDFIKDGIPAIGKAIASDSIYKGCCVLAEETLKILSSNLAKELQYRRTPEATYCIKLRETYFK